MVGALTLKVGPTAGNPFTLTVTLPVVAPEGTIAIIEVSLQVVNVTAVPLNVTVLAPCVAPKLVPCIVTNAPTVPDVGVMLATFGTTVKLAPLLATPPTEATMFPLPLAEPAGTGATMLLSLQLVGAAAMPLNIKVSGLEPKFAPLIVMDARPLRKSATRQ